MSFLNVQTKETTKTPDGRYLKEKDIKHIKTIGHSIFKHEKENASLTLAKQLQREYVNFESSLELFQKLEADTNILQRVYNDLLTDEEKLDNTFLSEILIRNTDIHPEQAEHIEDVIIQRISAPTHYGDLTKKVEDSVYIIISPEHKKTYKEIISYTRKGEENSNQILIMEAALKELTVYDNPIAQETRQFKSTWQTNLSPYPITYGPDMASEIAAQLTESGYVIKKREAEDTIRTSFAIFIERGLAEMKSEIETPGFYFDQGNKNLQIVKYDVPEDVDKKDIQKGLKTLEQFAEWFESQKTALATIFKWGLISPFIFAMKQKGGTVKWPFLYGNAGTGKSTFGKMVLYIWGEPNNDTNNIPGSGFDNEARIGDRLKQFTFPIVVDEPGALFERKGPSEMIKTAQENTTSRGKYVGRRYRTIPAFAPVIFTSNYKYPSSDASGEAFNRRFYPILFSRSERKPEVEQQKFNNEFLFENVQKCKLHDLKSLGQFVAIEIINDPKLLEMNWQELANTLLFRMYMDANLTPPKWIQEWSEVESLADLDEIHKENIRNFLVEEINKAFGQLQILDDEGKPKQRYDNKFDVTGPEDFENIVWSVLNRRRIPWALLGSDNNVYLTSGFLTALRKRECVNESLPSLSDLLGWKYKKGRVRSAGFSGVYLKVSRKNFTEFVFPLCQEEGVC